MPETIKYLINEQGMNKNLYELLKENNVKRFILRFFGNKAGDQFDVIVEYKNEENEVFNTSKHRNTPKNIEDIKNILHSVIIDSIDKFDRRKSADIDCGDDYYFDLDNNEIIHEEWHEVKYLNKIPDKEIEILE
jgi:hypothetical protein